VKLWLDDLRTPPDETWAWVKTVDDAIALMQSHEVAQASLDHDLGDDIPEGRKLVLWMAEHQIWPTEAITIHSANPVGADHMAALIERYGPFQRIVGTRRFTRRTRGSDAPST
jgi:hypothetical protein